MDGDMNESRCLETLSELRAVIRYLAFVVLLGAICPAMANVGSRASLNSCGENYQLLLHQTPAVQYAKTGKVHADWKPEHSRAFYMAALGMRDTLRLYLKKNRQLLQYSDLLTAATYADQRAIVKMLLEMGENLSRNGSDSWAVPLQIAARCERKTIMIYLLSAGADVYGVSSQSNFNAMAAALMPARLDPKPFKYGVQLLLTAGFDPRCPVTMGGATAVDIVSQWIGGKSSLDTKKLIETAAKIAAIRHPGKPNCGESGRQFRQAIR